MIRERTLRAKAFAKINLSLHIVGVRMITDKRVKVTS